MIIDWVAASMMLSANYLIGKHNRRGWLINMAAQVPVAWINWRFKMYGFFPMQVILMGIYIKNYRRWGNVNSRENS